MNDYGQLAYTGAGTLLIGGVLVDTWWLLAAGFALVTVGVLLNRFGWRRGRELTDR